MEVLLMIPGVLCAWAVAAFTIAVIFGRVAAAGEHEHVLDGMRLESIRASTRTLAENSS